MVLTPSFMVPLGTRVPDFSLEDLVSGDTITPAALAQGKAFLVVFLCRHCPYVQHIKEELARIGRDYVGRAAMVGISANDPEAHPDDAPDSLREMAAELGFPFPFCYDETQEVAKAFSAACTPDFFLYDANGRLAYRGQLDDSRPGNGIPVTGRDLRSALDAVLADATVSPEQKPSIGCNIKWKPGREPRG